ncbi:MAG: GGDEF domain-containing protein [Pseudomonadota bacterium]|nr:MAG: GGDEF domain-containing protein [Pseudomonadota bacterium]
MPSKSQRSATRNDSYRSGVPGVIDRLRAEVRLTIITLFGVGTIAGIFPFAVFRLVEGQLITAAGDCLLMVLLGGLLAYGWSSGRVELVGNIASMISAAGFLVLFTLTGASVFWAFIVLSASFLLAGRHYALGVCAITLIGVAVQTDRFASAVELGSFVIAGVLVSVFGLIFAWRTELQHRQLVCLARHDPLTGAGNRLALRSALEAHMERFHKQQRPAGLAMIDLDHFKQVNDSCGHEAGDQVLIQLVAIIRAVLREQDQVFRLGGEEFVLLLPDTDQEGLAIALRRLHDELRDRLAGPGGTVTVSIGAAPLTRPDPQHWLARADQALYRAKEAGRNRLEIADIEH